MKIEIATDRGMRLIEAEAVFGQLAVNRGAAFAIPVPSLANYPEDEDAVPWVGLLNITHIKTGYGLWSGLYRQFALKLAPLLAKLDWGFERPEEMPASLRGQSHEITVRLLAQLTKSADPEERRIGEIQEHVCALAALEATTI